MTTRKTATDPDAEQATQRAADADDAAQDNLTPEPDREPAPEPDSLDDVLVRLRRIEHILL